MKLHFIGDLSEVQKGLEILSARLGMELCSSGAEVRVSCRPGDLEVFSDGETAGISFEKKIHFFRALGLLKEHWGEKFSIREQPKFDKNGLMVDASRNAVMKPESICELMEIMAVMGQNLIMMYTEDTFEVPEYPYFGYMRGRYTEAELRACDDYADIFGIEMIPCIQTLAHFCKVLKWDNGLELNDTDDSLMVGGKDIEEFLRNVLQAATKPYRSRRVHIGMDEAWTLGLGKYLRKYGYTNPSELVRRHFVQVKRLCDELGIEAIMWSDMFFRACSATNGYYEPDIQFPRELVESVPEEVGLIYWDYYHKDQSLYDSMLKKHRELNQKTIFAGGIWLWGRLVVSNRMTFDCTIPALRACVENGVREVFATMWGDNGGQCDVLEAMLGMQLYAEFGYGHEPDEAYLARRFYACTGETAESFWALSSVDDLGQKDYANANPSEYLLWQDILIGLMDKCVDRDDLPELYRERCEKLKGYAETSPICDAIFDYTAKLAAVLELKADLGVRMKKAYDAGDRATLQKILSDVLPELEKRLYVFRDAYRDQWFRQYKSFGYEVIDMRFGALFARIDTAKLKLSRYLAGEISSIEELEPERLPYKLQNGAYGEGLNTRISTYLKYISAGYCSHGYYD